MEEIIVNGATLTGQLGVGTVCAWFMFRLEKILTKLTDTVADCPHRL